MLKATRSSEEAQIAHTGTPKRVRARPFFVYGFLVFCSVMGLWASDADSHIREGVRLHDAGDYDAAVAAFEKALEIDPANKVARYELANSYFAMREYAKCIATAEAGLEQASRLEELLHAIAGSCYSSSGQPKKALEHFRAGLEKFPDSVNLHFNIAVTLATTGKTTAAADHLERTTQLQPRYASPHFLLGVLSRDQSLRVKSFFYFVRFVTLEPIGGRSVQASATAFELLFSGIETKPGGDVDIMLQGTDDEDPSADLEMLIFFAGVSIQVDDEIPESATDADRQVKGLLNFLDMAEEVDDPELRETHLWQQAISPVLSLHSQGASEALAYYMAAQAQIPGAQSWIEEHAQEVEKLNDLLRPPSSS